MGLHNQQEERMARYNGRSVRGELALDNVCRDLVARLTEVARVATDKTAQTDEGASVISVFSALPRRTEAQRIRLGEAFRRLDDHPAWWGTGSHCQAWHALLRRTRNNPESGEALFALWS
jgi:hypothetical protein